MDYKGIEQKQDYKQYYFNNKFLNKTYVGGTSI